MIDSSVLHSCVQLGHGSPMDDKLEPSFVESLRGVEVGSIASLSTHSVAITRVGGKLLTWGNGDKHRLGHGSAEKEHAPRVMAALLHKAPVRSVACGLGHTLALLKNGQVRGRHDSDLLHTPRGAKALEPSCACRCTPGATAATAGWAWATRGIAARPASCPAYRGRPSWSSASTAAHHTPWR